MIHKKMQASPCIQHEAPFRQRPSPTVLLPPRSHLPSPVAVAHTSPSKPFAPYLNPKKKPKPLGVTRVSSSTGLSNSELPLGWSEQSRDRPPSPGASYSLLVSLSPTQSTALRGLEPRLTRGNTLSPGLGLTGYLRRSGAKRSALPGFRRPESGDPRPRGCLGHSLLVPPRRKDMHPAWGRQAGTRHIVGAGR